MKNIAIFASGSGTNAENIFNFFKNSDTINVKILLSNVPDAYVLQRARKFDIPSMVFSKYDFYDSDNILNILTNNNIDFVVLSGFLWLVPSTIINKYKNRIINIHPALLPKYGGRGMYGAKVHKAVIAAGEKESGITIHCVNEKYDSGDIIFQAKCAVLPNDTPETLAQKVHALEYEYFPKIIEQEIKLRCNVK